MVATAFVAAVFVQVTYRTQNRMRMRIVAETVKSQQDFAVSQATLSGILRPEVLRGIVAEIFPDYKTIGFTKNINITDIPLRSAENE